MPHGFKRKYEGVCEQKYDTFYTPLSDEELARMRQVHYDRTGDHPIECERPSDAQLTVLAARLKAGSPPVGRFRGLGPIRDQTREGQLLHTSSMGR